MVRRESPRIRPVVVLEAAFALVEHIDCFRLVLFNRSHCSLKHGFGFLCSAELSCRDYGGSEENQNQGKTDGECEIAQHDFLPVKWLPNGYLLPW